MAAQHSIPVFGLNITKKTLDALRIQDIAQVKRIPGNDLPPQLIMPTPKQTEKLTLFFKAHSSAIKQKNKKMAMQPTSSKASFDRFMLVQSLWDTAMATNALKVHQQTKRPVVILAGAGHVEYGYGIAHRIYTLAPEARILLIMPTATFPAHNTHAGIADLFFYSPPQPRRANKPSGLGISFQPEKGLTVRAVTPGSRAAQAGLQKGDVLLAMNGIFVKTPTDLHRAAMEKKNSVHQNITVSRNGGTLTIILPPAKGHPKAD